jgi:type II secretion system protein H
MIKRKPASSTSSGFTMIEMMVVVALMAIFLVIVIPSIRRAVTQSRLNGSSQELAAVLRQARAEAVRRSVPVVVKVDYENDEIFSFADINDGDGDPGSNLDYDPIGGAPSGSADYEIQRVRLASFIKFWGPLDSDIEGADAINGFTDVPDEDTNAVVFLPNGSVQNPGGFRIGDGEPPDDPRNFFEIRVAPQASARVQILKYNPDILANLDGTYYFEAGTYTADGEPTWEWE